MELPHGWYQKYPSPSALGLRVVFLIPPSRPYGIFTIPTGIMKIPVGIGPSIDISIAGEDTLRAPNF